VGRQRAPAATLAPGSAEPDRLRERDMGMNTSHRPRHPQHVRREPRAPRVPPIREVNHSNHSSHSSHPQRTWRPLALRVAGAGLLAATGAIHLDLYLTGYRTIPTIGWLFLLQVIAAFGLALVVGLLGSRLAAAAGALFALGTLGGYLLTIWFGLFGFREVRTTAGIVAGVIEVAAFAVLAVLALAPGPQHAVRGPAAVRVPGGQPGALATAGGVSVLALVLLGVAVAGAATAPAAPSSASSSSAASGQVLKTTQIKGVTVLTDSKGLTLYWFAPDTPTKSACYGACAAYWPPVLGRQKAGPGVTGTIGTIRRSDGTLQATYDSHPLYTYIGDSGPGQASGNDINLNGGLWHEVLAASG
jgi:predicted lipoprotein with Yx(FWY)xxD motif